MSVNDQDNIKFDKEHLRVLDEDEYKDYFLLFTQLKAALAEQPIKFVQFHVDYHGSGDNGDYDPATLTYWEDGEAETKFNYKMAGEYLSASLVNSLSEFITNKIDYDWYNNDGGGGTAFINLADGYFGYSGYWYETVSHDVEDGYKIGVK